MADDGDDEKFGLTRVIVACLPGGRPSDDCRAAAGIIALRPVSYKVDVGAWRPEKRKAAGPGKGEKEGEAKRQKKEKPVKPAKPAPGPGRFARLRRTA